MSKRTLSSAFKYKFEIPTVVVQQISLSALALASWTLPATLTLLNILTSVLCTVIHPRVYCTPIPLRFQLRSFAWLPAVSALLISPEPPFYSVPTNISQQ